MEAIMKFKKSVFTGLVTSIAAGALLLSNSAVAQKDWPTKSISLIVPFAAGGPTDSVARLIAVPMGQALGQTVVVENVPGAGGTIASTKVARAAPDGYTIYLHHMGMATANALYDKLPYDPLNSFEHIGQVADVPMVLLGKKSLPANNFKELEAYIKANGSKVTMANAGPGAVSQLCGLLFQSRLGVRLTNIPYKGTGPALTDLLGGQVDLLCDQTTQTIPYIKDGSVKAFGTTTLKRLPAIPNVPTLDEQGLKGFEVKVWHGMYAPKDTPKPILAKLNAALKKALTSPDVQKRLADANIDIVPVGKISDTGLKAHLEAEINKWGPVIRKANIPD
jgi:tripartite-type tricarboxylate transporter receptor subunit TctC